MKEIKRIKKNKIREEKSSEGEIKISKFSGIAWQAPEYEYRRKNISWYWISLIMTIILLFFSLWQKNFLFAIFIIIAWVMIINLTDRVPSIWEFKIDENGFSVGLPNRETRKFYPYSEIDFFDIQPVNEERRELILKFKSRFASLLKIGIRSVDEEKIRVFLSKFLKQKTIEPSLLDSVSRLIGF